MITVTAIAAGLVFEAPLCSHFAFALKRYAFLSNIELGAKA